MTENIIIPDKYYVGYQKRKNEDGVLGFPTPYGTDSASKKRMSTVDNWSSKDIQPTVYDNVLLPGYKIAQHIHRSYYWGGGNVVWRIEDPRGFEFEIESSNMSKILSCTNIINGEIQGKCILGRSNMGVNVLLPENSEPYINAVKSTVISKTSTKTSELVPGSIVLLKNNTKIVYLGKYYPLFVEYEDNKKMYGDAKDSFINFKLSCDKAYYLYLEYDNNTSTNGISTKVNVTTDIKASSVVGIDRSPENARAMALSGPYTGNYRSKIIVGMFDKKEKPVFDLVDDPDREHYFENLLNGPNKKYYTEYTAFVKYRDMTFVNYGYFYNDLNRKQNYSHFRFCVLDKSNGLFTIKDKQYLSRIKNQTGYSFIKQTCRSSGMRFGGYEYNNSVKYDELTSTDFTWQKMSILDGHGNVMVDRLVLDI